MKIEVWKTYPEFPFIQGSNLGRVRTLDRYVNQGNKNRFVKWRILKQYCLKNRYLQVSFGVKVRKIKRYTHHIIASCFIPNPIGLPEVNHRNCDRTDNRLSNLEFCTRSYNIAYKEKYGISAAEALGYSFYAINLETQEKSHFESQYEAERELGVSQQNINKVLKGKRKTAGGYWFVKDTGNDFKVNKDKLREIKDNMEYRGGVVAINVETSDVLCFESQRKAGRELGVAYQNINHVLKGQRKQTHGYWFTKADENAVKITRNKFSDEVADKVEKLMEKTQITQK